VSLLAGPDGPSVAASVDEPGPAPEHPNGLAREGKGDVRSGWALGVPVVLAVAGLLMATSAQTARGTDLRSERRTDLADLVRAQETRAEAAQQAVQQLRADIDRLTAAQGVANAPVAQARSQGDAVAPSVGLTSMTGPGVVVTLDDAQRDPGTPLPAGVTADDLLVHQQDLQAVVNALWAGGAQGVEVMDQRLVSTSAVRCVGNTLLLHGRVYSPPFTVSAVGDVRQLDAALRSSPALVTYREWVDAVGLGYQVSSRTSLQLPPYTGDLDLVHAEAATP
jgi:uncharacterized protein YlxW (UPF0749 family)